MVSKVLVGLLGAAVVSAGGYAYFRSASEPAGGGCGCTAGQNTTELTTPTSCFDGLKDLPGCCGFGDEVSAPEAIAIEPREVK